MFNSVMHGLLFIFCFLYLEVEAATTSGGASAYIATALTVSTLNNIDFGTAPQGDPAKLIAPTSLAAAAFSVLGESNMPYTISLPAFVDITNASGKTIRVDTFSSFPSGSGMLDANGAQTLKVGARRAALALNQSVGIYSGSFTITVVY